MTERKYSVLISVYKNEKAEFLAQSLESIVRQTLMPDEIVFVRDGELTPTLDDVVSGFSVRFPGLFNVVALSENVGLGRALDEGLKHCRNDLVARMDSDDISLPERCELQVNEFNADPSLCIVGTMVDEFYDEPSNIVSVRAVPVLHDDILKFIRRRSPFNHPSVMFRKSEVLRCGGYGKMKRKQDMDLFSRMMNSGCKAMNIDRSLLLFRSNEDNFKRRKSWSYCRSYIEVQFEIWKRGHCGFGDLLYVTAGQLLMFLAPMPVVKKLSSKYLRRNKV